MAVISKILVPVEFSPRCLGSAQYAEALACHFHSELVLLHVRVPPSLPYSADVTSYSTAIDLNTELLERAKAQLDDFPLRVPAGVHAERVVMEGDPAASIVEFARDGRFDLLVMPTHGYGPFRRFLLGSVTAKVLHDAACPVWTGPHMEGAPSYDSISFHTVLCAVDLQAESRAVLEWADGFAREFGAALHVIHVLHSSPTSMGGLQFDVDWHADMVRQARAEVRDLVHDTGVSGEVMIETGETADTIREAAQRLKARVVVIGRGRHRGLLGRLRTNAYAILRESPCPVAAV